MTGQAAVRPQLPQLQPVAVDECQTSSSIPGAESLQFLKYTPTFCEVQRRGNVVLHEARDTKVNVILDIWHSVDYQTECLADLEMSES